MKLLQRSSLGIHENITQNLKIVHFLSECEMIEILLIYRFVINKQITPNNRFLISVFFSLDVFWLQ